MAAAGEFADFLATERGQARQLWCRLWAAQSADRLLLEGRGGSPRVGARVRRSGCRATTGEASMGPAGESACGTPSVGRAPRTRRTRYARARPRASRRAHRAMLPRRGRGAGVGAHVPRGPAGASLNSGCIVSSPPPPTRFRSSCSTCGRSNRRAQSQRLVARIERFGASSTARKRKVRSCASIARQTSSSPTLRRGGGRLAETDLRAHLGQVVVSMPHRRSVAGRQVGPYEQQSIRGILMSDHRSCA